MKRSVLLLIFIYGSFSLPGLYGDEIYCFNSSSQIREDTTLTDQLLNNGRIWRNFYQNAVNDQFLFTSDYILCTITILGKVYPDIKLKYDICNDELITPGTTGNPIQLNKEMIDSFSIDSGTATLHFRNLTPDSITGLGGYCKVIYEGKSSLYLKYTKELYHLSGQNTDIQFFQKTRLYLVSGRRSFPVRGKRDLLKALEAKEELIKSFISRNRFHFEINDPESVIQVVKYFDSITQ